MVPLTHDQGRHVISHNQLPLDPDAGSPRPIHVIPSHLLAVFVGGCVGTLLRYGAGQLVPHTTDWPVATFVVNVVGAFVLGVLLEALSRSGSVRGTRIRLLAGTGFCGGLTTYSTFAVEVDLLIRGGSAWLAVAYGLCSLVAGVAAAYAGIAGATRVRS